MRLVNDILLRAQLIFILKINILCPFKMSMTIFVMFSDVNECRSVHHNCHENADCMDKEGTYQCHCTGRYYGDGKTCYGRLLILTLALLIICC